MPALRPAVWTARFSGDEVFFGDLVGDDEGGCALRGDDADVVFGVGVFADTEFLEGALLFTPALAVPLVFPLALVFPFVSTAGFALFVWPMGCWVSPPMATSTPLYTERAAAATPPYTG